MKHPAAVEILVLATACRVGEASREDVVPDVGLEVTGSEAVADVAKKQAHLVVNHMLSNAPRIVEKMKAARFKVEIIPKDEVLTDLPDYAYLKGKTTADGRNYDTGTRGLGGTDKCSIGEENLLCLRKQPYWQEDILVHEFAHSMKSNMDAALSLSIDEAYRSAIVHGLYPQGAYIATNSQEYWAEGTQAWFGVTERTDVNGGFNTAAKLRARDPQLASILLQVFGAATIPRVPGCPY